MSASLGAVLRESTDRLTTAAGAAIFGLLLSLSFLNTLFAHNQGGGEEREQLEQFEDELRADDPEAAEALEGLFTFFDLLFESQQVFDVGIPDLVASALGFLILVPFALAVLVSVRAIGENRDQLDGSVLEGLGWRSVNFIGGSIGLGILLFVLLLVFGVLMAILSLIPVVGLLFALLGLFLTLVLPVLIGVLLFYWTPAIAVGNDNAFEAVKTSVSVARNNVVSTVVLVILYILLTIGNFGLFVGLLYVAGPTITAVTSVVAGAVLWFLVVGWMGTGYDLADTESEEPQPPGQQEWERGQGTGPADTGDGWNDRRSDNTDGEWGSTQGEQSESGPEWAGSESDQGSGRDSDGESTDGWSVDDDEPRE